MIATMFPDIVPGTWSIYNAASPADLGVHLSCSRLFGLFPVMIMYNWYQIWVFRARVAKLVSH